MKKTFIVIDARREGYGPDQVMDNTMTVGELIDYLREYDSDVPVILSHDNGYTYGAISDYGITEDYFEVDDE